MATITIDLGDGRTAPMTPPPALGAAFFAVVAEALGWDDTRQAEADAALDTISDTHVFQAAAERIGEALSDADLDWSCQFGSEGEPEAGPYIDTLHENQLGGVGYVAAAVLARDLAVVTETDFQTVTGWWVAAGLPLPGPRPGASFAADEDEVTKRAMAVRYARGNVPGWPLAAVA